MSLLSAVNQIVKSWKVDTSLSMLLSSYCYLVRENVFVNCFEKLMFVMVFRDQIACFIVRDLAC